MKLTPAVPVLAAALCFSISCEDEKPAETTPQAAIGSFTLGYYDVLTSEINYLGNDTVIRVREYGGKYPLTIDQLNNRIYNTDSLAYGSDVSSVTCSILSKGTVVYEYLDDPGTGYVYSSSEPVDFSRPLSFTVISGDLSYIRKYEFKLNVHQIFPDSLLWEMTSAPALSSPQLSVMDNTLYLLGLDGTGTPSVSVCPLQTGIWTDAVPASGLTGQPESMMALDGTLYANCGHRLCSSTDGLAWTTVRDGVKALYAPTRNVSGTSAHIWMLDTDGRLCHSADMRTWTVFQNLPPLFPDSSATAHYSTLKTNSDIRRTVLAGSASKDGHTLLWNILSTDTAWTEISAPAHGEHNLPVMDNIRILDYDGSMFALGSGLEGFYQSKDNGITWYYCSRVSYSWSPYNRFMQLPQELHGYDGQFACVTDNNGGICIVTSQGQSWYGAITRLRK